MNRSYYKNIISYGRLHIWVRTTFGKADHCENPFCSGKSKTFDYALKHEVKELIHDKNIFIQLCRSCHMKYDMTDDKKITLALNGRGNKGKIRTEEMRKNISLSGLGRPGPHKGMKFNKITRKYYEQTKGNISPIQN